MTQSQFKRLGGIAAHISTDKGDNLPVEKITWFEARDFCANARGARLPTEAEWEYAARGPDNLVYPWGNTFVGDNVVFLLNSNNQSADVGSRPAGASWVGAWDMSGNVWQWVSTIYAPYPYNTSDVRENVTDATRERGLRGGSWNTSEPNDLRTALRFGNNPSWEDGFDGFRCSLSQ